MYTLFTLFYIYDPISNYPRLCLKLRLEWQYFKPHVTFTTNKRLVVRCSDNDLTFLAYYHNLSNWLCCFCKTARTISFDLATTIYVCVLSIQHLLHIRKPIRCFHGEDMVYLVLLIPVSSCFHCWFQLTSMYISIFMYVKCFNEQAVREIVLDLDRPRKSVLIFICCCFSQWAYIPVLLIFYFAVIENYIISKCLKQ